MAGEMGRFWTALETFPGMVASTVEWRAALGADWDWARRLLRPLGSLAESIILEGELHTVTHHDTGRVVAVPTEGGQGRLLAQGDAELLRLNDSALAKGICSAMGFEVGGGRSTPFGLHAQCGRVKATAGTYCPVHLCTIADAETRTASIFRLLAEANEPAVFLVPSTDLAPEAMSAVRHSRGCVIRLADCVQIGKNLEFISTPVTDQRLGEFSIGVEAWERGSRTDEPYCFERVADGVWMVSFDRQRNYIPHKEASALAHIQLLIASPRKQIWVEDLEAAVHGHAPVPRFQGDELLDEDAREDLEAHVAEARDDLASAARRGDSSRRAEIEARIGALTRQLDAARGFGGRVRPLASEIEKARVRVTRVIDSAIERAREAVPALGAHLHAFVNTGATLSYTPDWLPHWSLGSSVTRRVTE